MLIIRLRKTIVEYRKVPHSNEPCKCLMHGKDRGEIRMGIAYKEDMNRISDHPPPHEILSEMMTDDADFQFFDRIAEENTSARLWWKISGLIFTACKILTRQ